MDECLAFLVLGPSHGARIFVSNPPPDTYLTPSQSTMHRILHAKEDDAVYRGFPVNVYRRTTECRLAEHRGCWIYEFDGERRG